MTNSNFHIQMQPLIEIIKNSLKTEKEKGTQIDICAFDKWEAASLDYSDKGFHLSMSGHRIPKPYPYSVASKISSQIQKTPEYLNLIAFLRKNTNIEENPVNLVNYFLLNTIEKYFENENEFDAELIRNINALVADLTNQPNKTRVIVEFYGVILRDDEITISSEMVLRKPRKEDFYIEIPSSPFFHHPDFPEPTAFLDFTLQARNRLDIQKEILKTISILQLFRPINITWHIYQIISESFNPCFKRKDPSIEKHLKFDNYILKTEDGDNLQKFWNEISIMIPKNFDQIDGEDSDYKSIAYNRYFESLLQRESVERKITNAMMGFEAIYFKPTGERQELQYRLAMRVAKIFRLLSFNSIEVKTVIKDAYGIRSIFSHGGNISNLPRKEKQYYNSKYGKDLKKLLDLVQDYLRLSIIVSITIQQKKIDFLSDIDNAMIDPIVEQKLIDTLKRAISLSSYTNVE